MTQRSMVLGLIVGLLTVGGCSSVSPSSDADGGVDALSKEVQETSTESDIHYSDEDTVSSFSGDLSPEEGWQDPDTGNTVVVSDDAVEITEADGTTVLCYKASCDGRVLECGDCVDNDGDGKADARDRECLGPCDNTEGPALISGVGGVTGSTCHVDCYFDYGNGIGTGSDDCWWDHQCDPLEPEKAICPYSEQRARNEKFCPETQSERCTDVCLPFTPNGCDCFGCCTFPELAGLGPNGDDGYVFIGAKDSSNNGSCTFDDILDETRCPRCTPIPNCLNGCDTCELCIGKTELPAECYDGPDGDVPDELQCPDGSAPCGLEDQPLCESGFFCISGCCQPTTPVV